MNELTAEDARRLLVYEPSTGLLTWRVRAANCVMPGDVAGSVKSNGYIEVGIRKRTYRAHRLAWLIHFGSWPVNHIDHRNGVRTDNRIDNLRDVTSQENNQNQFGPQCNSRSGVLGVSKHRGKWRVTIGVNGSVRYIGRFDDIDEAASAYREAKARLHPFWADGVGGGCVQYG